MKENTNINKKYYINKKGIHVPNLGFDIKISNFKDSSIIKTIH